MSFEWKGVMPAITTCFNERLEIDHEFTARHVKWLVDNGSMGIVTNGSLGEGATLTTSEKSALWQTCIRAVGERVPVIAAIGALSTDYGVELAKRAEAAGCAGLMVLPPYVHNGDWRETRAHVSAIIGATPLTCMLYNNPVAYGVDFTPAQIVSLADEHPNLNAVKDSSGDARKISAIRELDKDRLAVFVGLDDALVEGVAAGAKGWIAGLVNALPVESVNLFELARRGENCDELYHWFLPLLRLDTVPKFVQLIKLVQARVGMGNARVRPPRLEIEGEELEQALEMITAVLGKRAAA
ncbi:MAG: dihydrodipicolinate synthase family protein [Acidobacteriota bacterium]|nr:dihydrodipicolinate synthase family protein [Acidobacteriota bacterium]MDH3530663.1 dihydrodipicolinate synthase family protein [Acidobacteriota bacterium]